MAHRFRELEIWKLSRSICSTIYKVTATFPDGEKFGMTNQFAGLRYLFLLTLLRALLEDQIKILANF